MPLARQTGFDDAFNNYLISGADLTLKDTSDSLICHNDKIVSASISYRNSWVCKNLPNISASVRVFWNKLSATNQNKLSTKNAPVCLYYKVENKSTTEPIMLYVKNATIDYDERFATIELVDILQILTQDLMTVGTTKYKANIHISEWGTYIKQASNLINSFIYEYDPYVINFRSDRTLAEAIQEIAINTGCAICFEPAQVSNVWKMNIAFRQYTNASRYVVYPSLNIHNVISNAYTLADETTSVEVVSLYNMNIEPNISYSKILPTDVFYIGCNYMFSTGGSVQVYNTNGTAIGTAQCDSKGYIHFTPTSWSTAEDITVAITLNVDNIQQYVSTNNTAIISSMTHDVSINLAIQTEAEAYYANDEYLEYNCRMNPAIIPLDNANGVLVEEVKLEFNGAYSGTIKGRKVKNKVLVYISADNPKTNYYQYDTFVKPTMTAYYNDGTSEVVTNDCVFSGYNLNNYGTQTVNVSYTYNGVTKTFGYVITVAKLIPTALALGGTIKTSYYVGDTFAKPTSATATFNNGNTQSVTNDVVYSGYNMSSVGNQTVTATYTYNGVSVTTTYAIEVVDLTPVSLALSNVQEEQGYMADLKKPTVTVTYDNGTTANVTYLCTYSGYNTSNLGNQTVTVQYTYNGTTVSTSFGISVVLLPPEFEIHEMTGYPNEWLINVLASNFNGVPCVLKINNSYGTTTYGTIQAGQIVDEEGTDDEYTCPELPKTLFEHYVEHQQGTLVEDVVAWFEYNDIRSENTIIFSIS